MMFIKLYKINRRLNGQENEFYLSEVSVNISHITYLAENSDYKKMLSEGKMNLNLHQNAQFTDITLLDKQSITVVGNPTMIESKIVQNSSKTLLRG